MVWLKLACCFIWSIGAARGDERPTLIADLDRDVTAFYQRFRESDSDHDKLNAIIDLCQLHNQILGDPRYATIEKLRGMRSQVVFQLKAAQKVIRKSLAAAAKASVGGSRDEGAASQRRFLSPVADQTPDGDALRQELVNALLIGFAYTPGPDQIAVHAGSFGGGDYGPELIALIESTIHPEHWDTNGGPGNIYYYRPVMALVVRAGSVVHDDLTDMLQVLRDNGQ